MASIIINEINGLGTFVKTLPVSNDAIKLDISSVNGVEIKTLIVESMNQIDLDNAVAVFDFNAAKIAERWTLVRKARNQLLRDSDFTQLGDYPGNKASAVLYRKALRDLPTTQNDPFNIVWPIL